MTVKELKAKLAKAPDNMEVFVAERVTDFAYGSVGSAYEKTINFQEEPGSKVLSKDRVFVIDEM